MKNADNAAFFEPPGGILVWIFILLELFTFSIGILFFIYAGKEEPEVFRQSKSHLNLTYGVMNTAILLTSGFFMAEAARCYKKGDARSSARMISCTALFGVAFLALKAFEYYDKIQAGFSLEYNTFFTFYWLMTGFHYVHVLVGVVILAALYSISRQPQNETNLEYFAAGAAFWHLCDLIWLIIFPVLYLYS